MHETLFDVGAPWILNVELGLLLVMLQARHTSLPSFVRNKIAVLWVHGRTISVRSLIGMLTEERIAAIEAQYLSVPLMLCRVTHREVCRLLNMMMSRVELRCSQLRLFRLHFLCLKLLRF